MEAVKKIRHCPFCGKQDFSVIHSLEGSHAYVVKCWSCGAIGPYGASNHNLAIEFWNERKMTNIPVNVVKDIIDSQME